MPIDLAAARARADAYELKGEIITAIILRTLCDENEMLRHKEVEVVDEECLGECGRGYHHTHPKYIPISSIAERDTLVAELNNRTLQRDDTERIRSELIAERDTLATEVAKRDLRIIAEAKLANDAIAECRKQADEVVRLKEALAKANDAYEDGRWTDIYETANTMHAVLDAALAPLHAKVSKGE